MRELQEQRVTFRQVAQFPEHCNVEVPPCYLGVGLCLAPALLILHRLFSRLHFLTCNRRKLGSISPRQGCMSSKDG